MCLHSCTKTAILSDSSCYSDLIETAGTVLSTGEQCSAGEQCSVTATVLRVERIKISGIKISGTVFSTMNSVPMLLQCRRVEKVSVLHLQNS